MLTTKMVMMMAMMTTRIHVLGMPAHDRTEALDAIVDIRSSNLSGLVHKSA